MELNKGNNNRKIDTWIPPGSLSSSGSGDRSPVWSTRVDAISHSGVPIVMISMVTAPIPSCSLLSTNSLVSPHRQTPILCTFSPNHHPRISMAAIILGDVPSTVTLSHTSPLYVPSLYFSLKTNPERALITYKTPSSLISLFSCTRLLYLHIASLLSLILISHNHGDRSTHLRSGSASPSLSSTLLFSPKVHVCVMRG